MRSFTKSSYIPLSPQEDDNCSLPLNSNNIFVVTEENYSSSQMKIGYSLLFNSGERKIIDIKQNGSYFNITVDGEKLDPVKDGYPNKIKLVGNK